MSCIVCAGYLGASAKGIIIHPAALVASAAAFTHEAEAMRDSDLRRLVKHVREFFKAFVGLNFADLSIPHIQKLVDTHGLSVDAPCSPTTARRYLLHDWTGTVTHCVTSPRLE